MSYRFSKSVNNFVKKQSTCIQSTSIEVARNAVFGGQERDNLFQKSQSEGRPAHACSDKRIRESRMQSDTFSRAFPAGSCCRRSSPRKEIQCPTPSQGHTDTRSCPRTGILPNHLERRIIRRRDSLSFSLHASRIPQQGSCGKERLCLHRDRHWKHGGQGTPSPCRKVPICAFDP